jgi:hypothetical protein
VSAARCKRMLANIKMHRATPLEMPWFLTYNSSNARGKDKAEEEVSDNDSEINSTVV